MPELLAGLQALTGGAMTKLGGANTQRMVREINNLAQDAGIGLPAVAAMMQGSQLYAMKLGLDPVFGARATEGTLAGMQAYSAMNIAATPMWGLSTQADLGQKEGVLQASPA
jgi:N-acyl-D-aspartate/D-glutamate deacylase